MHQCHVLVQGQLPELPQDQEPASRCDGPTDGDSSSSQKKPCRKPVYLQNKDGTTVSGSVLHEMSSKVQLVWVSLQRRKMAPQTFGMISSEAWEFLARAVLPLQEFEFLLYCNNGQWKLKEWCKDNYSSWTRNHGLRPPPVKKIENMDDNILNNPKLLQMESPSESSLGGDVSTGNSGAMDQIENSDEEDNGKHASDEEYAEVPIPRARQQVRHALSHRLSHLHAKVSPATTGTVTEDPS